MFQADTLLPWRTALRNVKLGIEERLSTKAANERSMELLQKVGLAHAANKFPHQLSGGMRQRVNLARALATEPTVLLMDEPFAALDAQTRENLQDHLLKVWQDEARPTVIFVTHDIEEAVFLADTIVVLAAAPLGIVKIVQSEFRRPRRLNLKDDQTFTRLVSEIKALIRKVSNQDKIRSIEGEEAL